MVTEYKKEGFSISTDKSKLDLQVIHGFLTESYWAKGVSFEVVGNSIENSLCFGLYEGQKQVGFARVITDYATFAWIADVFILEPYRGKGLARWLVECIVDHPELRGLRRLLLATRDAHNLYRKVGFEPLRAPERWMERKGRPVADN